MSLIGSGFLTIFSFVFVISIVVVIHELGHYWAGRICGVHAEAFSMGFGPTLFSWRDKRGTVWRVAAFPLGGYVKFLGDAGAASEPDEAKLKELRRLMGADADKCYHFKPIWQRARPVCPGIQLSHCRGSMPACRRSSSRTWRWRGRRAGDDRLWQLLRSWRSSAVSG